MYRRWWTVLIGLTVTVCAANGQTFDVVVYGGTAGGVVAAVQVARMGKTVAIVEPTAYLGGLTTNGLGATDIGHKEAIGGIAREFYRQIRQYYDRPEAWRWQAREDYRASRDTDRLSGDAMWTFEPHVAEQILETWARQPGVTVYRQQPLLRPAGVRKSGPRIMAITTVNNLTISGHMFIDATYEGDLLAAAGVSYTIGREPNSQYGETLNGVQTRHAVHHQLQAGIDPFVRPGDPASGLLPGIDPQGPGEEGGGDRRVQAYNLRMCNTTHPENRLPFERPADYNELDYELLLRNFAAGETTEPWHPVAMPNLKSDTNNNRGVSTDYIGQSYRWPEADDATRRQIYREHLRYHQGLMWTLANHSRVPAEIRAEFQRWGNCRDEFTDNGGWPRQLYVREARRMVSDTIMTQHHCQGRERAVRSIGLAAYTMDSHNVQRYVDRQGHVRNEGDVQVGGFPPYPIDYGAIVPKETECTNLLVPVCLSASHIAYGSIRMEPVFMVLGQSAATAACQALDAGVSVQRVDGDPLQARLGSDGQVLTWGPEHVRP